MMMRDGQTTLATWSVRTSSALNKNVSPKSTIKSGTTLWCGHGQTFGFTDDPPVDSIIQNMATDYENYNPSTFISFSHIQGLFANKRG